MIMNNQKDFPLCVSDTGDIYVGMNWLLPKLTDDEFAQYVSMRIRKDY